MKNLLFSLSLILICIFSASQTFSQSLTTNPNQNQQLLPSQIVLTQASCGNTTITQSISQTIFPDDFACQIDSIVQENSFYRAFDLTSFRITEDFDVCAIQVGINPAFGGSGGQQPATVKLYTSSRPFPRGFPGSLNLIGTTGVIQIANQNLTIVTIPVTGTAPAGSELVVELFIPDGTDAGNAFGIGSNSIGETGPSYIRAPACKAPTPVTTAAIGAPFVHFVMNVIGNKQNSENISLGPETDTKPAGTEHTVTAVIENNGVREQGRLVSFEVISGPNAGEASDPNSGECSPNDDCTTDENGQISWTYLGSRNVGTDTISATFTNDNSGIILSNFIQKIWLSVTIPTLSQWGAISIAGILGLFGFIALRKRKAAA